MIRSRHAVLLAFLIAACSTPPPSATTSPSEAAIRTQSPSGLAAPFPTPSTPGGTAAEAPACRTSNLSISITNTGGGAGNVGGYLRFLNTATEPCFLQGPPTLTAVTAEGATVVARVSIAVGTPFPVLSVAPKVTLTPGEAAFAAYGGSDNPGTVEAACPPGYHTFVVAPPGDATTVELLAFNTWLAQDQPSCAGIAVTVIAPAVLVQQYNDLSSLRP